jgi:urease accessory protein
VSARPPDSTTRLRLLHLCDSAFPIGGYVHSDGLETATSDGHITTALQLREWIDASLSQTLAQCDAAAVALAWTAFHTHHRDALKGLDEEVLAIRAASAARDATRAMGSRLLNTWLRLYPSEDLTALAGVIGTLPVAFGAISAASGIEKLAAVEGFIYTRLSATVSAAVRLLPIGQAEAQALLAATLRGVEAAARDAASRDSIACFAPALDIAQMSHQYVFSRLFRS